MEIIRKSSLPGLNSYSFRGAFIEKTTYQRENTGTSYKLSKYNFIKEFEGKYIIYNLASDAVVIADYKEIKPVLHIKNVNLTSSELLGKLAEMGILVNSEIDEDLVLSIIRQNQIANPDNELKIAINTTYGCNAHCDYCFECGADHSKMTYETADKVADYICNAVNEDTLITYRWFGGEPLLATDIIDRIIRRVNDHFDNNIRYRSVILSNGTVYNDEIIHKIKNEWKVYEFHVTVDGEKDVHNRKKNFLNKDFDGYTKMMHLVKLLLDSNITVACRINVDKNNLQDLEKIVASFDKYPNKRLLNVYAAPVRRHTKESEKYCFDYIEYNDVFEEIYRILYNYDLLGTCDYIVPKRKVTCCSTRATNEIVVDTKGDLYKCMQTATNDQFSVGNCEKGLIYNKELAQWLIPQTPDECQACIYMPICQAGCKGFRSLNNPYVSPCVNERYYLDTILKYVYKMSEEANL